MVQPHPTLAELTERLLAREPAERQGGEVEPYHQSLPHQWIDPLLLWPDAVAAAPLLLPKEDAAAFAPTKLKMPASWRKALNEAESVRLVPLALGQVPAQLKDITPLLDGGPLALRETPKPVPAAAAEPVSLASMSLPQRLLDAALDRLDRRFLAASAKLQGLIEDAPESWRTLLENEAAALLWAEGRREEAEALWTASAASFTPAFQFNRAVAALGRGDLQAALPLLRSAAAAFPASGGWLALAQLYLALLETA